MMPTDCHPGMLVRLCSAPGRIWKVLTVDGNWAELQHRESGARVQITVSSLLPVDDSESWQERVWAEALRAEPPRSPSLPCWAAIIIAVAFAALHVWAAIRIGRGTAGLDPTGAAVAIGFGGAGWTAWFTTLLWITWRSRR